MEHLSELVDVANPQEPHCATILLLDVSGSMGGGKIKQLNDGLRFFKEDICGADGEGGDPLARKRIDLCIITFSSSANVVQSFTSMDEFVPPSLIAEGSTAMGEAIRKASEVVEQRKKEYKMQGVDYYRPWIFLITDGEPSDMKPGTSEWNGVAQLLRDAEAKQKFVFFTVGVDPADMEVLRQLAPPERPPVQLRPGMFRGLFQWLSKSLSAVSSSKVGEKTQLQNPTIGPNPWAV